MSRQALLCVFTAALVSGCAASGPVYPDVCGRLDAAAPALLEATTLGLLTGAATRNRAAGVATGVATGFAAYARERDRCLMAAEQRRREDIERAQREAESRRWEEARTQREWAHNNRCVTQTTDEFGRRVRDRRECTHVEYGVRY